MNVSRHQVSLGALALVLCLALPMGVLSLFSPATTGDQIDGADAIFVARVKSQQVVTDSGLQTVIELAVEKRVSGDTLPAVVTLTIDGRPAVDVGDLVIAMVGFGPDEVLGFYHLQKDPRTLQYDVVTPLTGLYSLGVSDLPPVPWALFEKVIHVRRGEASIDTLDGYLPGDEGGDQGTDGGDVNELIGPDGYEPNDDLASATPVFPGPPKVVTGNPLLVTGLSLTQGDVDFFGFDGPGLTILHAETQFPEGVTGNDLDSLMGLFDASNGDLLAVDDDSGKGKLSRLTIPLEFTGPYAVGVESAPDTNLDFAGDEGTTTGEYTLSLELEKASYLSNQSDRIAGVSPDGTFIEDFVGFKKVGGIDVLRVGVPADGWGVRFDVQSPKGVTSVFGGAGDQLDDPGFDTEPQQLSFELGPFVDSNGFNRSGFAKSIVLIPNSVVDREGLLVRTQYSVSKNQSVIRGYLILQGASRARLENISYQRVMDVDLFGTGADTFYWSSPTGKTVRSFPVDTNTVVGEVTDPATTTGIVTGDMQFAFTVDRGDAIGFEDLRAYPMAFSLVTDFVSKDDAVQSVVQNLKVEDIETWVVAVDQDPDTGLYSAFGAGLGVRRL
ncbi:MAG: hypothetical protein H6825_00730 [Planctomycetes bacterium]|nr:hypothetical protein [Planctomycetota bacterium]